MAVAPDGAGPENKRKGAGRTAVFVAAALVVAIGFVALGALSTSNQTATPESATTSTTTGEIVAPVDLENFSISQIVTGPQPDWTLSGEFEGSFPIGLTEHDGAIYLFTTEIANRPSGGGGMTAWRSQDGVEWASLGQVLNDDAVVSTVVSTSQGLIAAGHPAGGTGLVIWTSADGTRWTASDIPFRTDSPYLVTHPTAIGGTDDALVVAEVTSLDTALLIESRLADVGFDFDPNVFTWNVDWMGEEGHVLSVLGPLGIEVFEVVLDDLELTSEEREWVANGFDRRPAARIWVQRNGSAWRESLIEGAFSVDQIVGRPDGSVLAFGFGPVGPLVRRSKDGLEWTSIDDDFTPRDVQAWRDDLVGLDDTSRPEVVVSDVGRFWEPLGMAERLPPALSWGPTAMDAGPSGVAVAVQGWTKTSTARLDPATFALDDGASLTVDFEQGSLELETPERTYTLALSSPSGEEQGGIEIDTEDRSVAFVDPETGELLAEVGFAELREAEAAYFADTLASDEHRAFLYTPDGSEWTIQDLSAEIAEGGRIGKLEVGTERLLAVVQRPQPHPMFGGQSLVEGGTGFEVWSAEIP